MTPIAPHKYEQNTCRFIDQSIDIVVSLPIFKL